MKPFSLLIKPASADCNLRCSYCFYLEKSALYPGKGPHRMAEEVLERVISSYMSTPQPVYQFGWQGGEPALMGNGFFRRAAALQAGCGPPGSEAANGLQTNATLIDDNFAAVLAEYKFLAGVSIDGPPEAHDLFRRDASGRGSHADVLRGIKTLEKHNVEFNSLTLVSSANALRGAGVYKYLKELGVMHQQYIPCVEFDGRGGLMPYSVRGPEWGRFLLEIFEEWLRADARKVSVRLFDSILSILVLNRRTSCDMGENCCQYFVVEYNGDIYPCDFFVEPGRKLGNIMESGWEELLSSPGYLEFGRQKARVHKKCRDCEFINFCMGGCPRHRYGKSADPDNLSALCRGWKDFYKRALPEFKKIAAELKTRSPGRNKPCPCGSGRKHKKCCGAAKKS